MSVSFCTVFESKVPIFGTLGSDHCALVRVREQLERLAADNGFTPLAAYESYDPADLADLMDDEEMAAELPPPEWFAPAAGLAAVRGVLAYLKAHPNALPKQVEVVADLSGIADELKAAQRAGVRFRFAVVM